MEIRHLVLIAIASISVLSILAFSHGNSVPETQINSNDNGFLDMHMGMMKHHNYENSQNFMHSKEDIEWMREMMKEQMNISDGEIDEMIEDCPMMQK